MNNSFDQPEEIDQSNAEGSVSATLSTESTSDPVSQDVMPDLDFMPEPKENLSESDPEPSKPEYADSTDVLRELGELRFADEN